MHGDGYGWFHLGLGHWGWGVLVWGVIIGFFVYLITKKNKEKNDK